MVRYWPLLAVVGLMWGGVTMADAPPSLQQIQNHLQSLYTPHGRPGGLRTVTGEEPFSGDCKDYYTAAMHQLLKYGYRPTAAIGRVRTTGIFHIMACAEEAGQLWCLDNTSAKILSRRAVRARYAGIEFREFPPG